MALSKTLPTDFGIDATYHNIGGFAVDFKNKGAEVTLYSYLDGAARGANRQPLGAVKVQIVGQDFTWVGGEISRTEIYEKIKARPEWEDATDN